MIILGIDPGTVRMGYGCIKKDRGLTLVECGLIGDADQSRAGRLVHLADALAEVLERCKPDVVGVEKVYFSKNKKTALAVAEARGVVLSALARLGVPIHEFTPSDVKRVVAGDGRCDKQTLARVVELTLGEGSIEGPDDVSDALAVAIRASFEKPL